MAAIDVTRSKSGDAQPGPLLRTLALCDLVDSTAIVDRLGDTRAAELMRKHDRIARAILQRHGGQEIDKTDGFLLLFERPVQAIAFALEYHAALVDLSAGEDASLKARVGIHVGDVLVWHNAAEEVARGAKPVEVEGLAKPIAARLMGLALPGQTLMSAVTHGLVQRSLSELPTTMRVEFRAHGRYRFKGVAEPVPVVEVGEEARAPFQRPASGSKAWRVVPWWRRPAAIVAEILAVAATIGGIAWLSAGPEEAFAFAERDWVVIADLRNLTGQPVLDDSLDAAMHLGLEQSRFVNVLPDLQLRDALRRMQRPPESAIDRNAAVEIALREGARAVVLPTADEVGGRVRVSIEVINPANSVTVYSDHADGAGLESVLPSTDLVLKRVRERLGESLASISEDNVPLERVATPNLDALRAYSLGVETIGAGQYDEADELFQRALELDHEFAAAILKRATIAFQLGRIAEARSFVEEAAGLKDRLAPRDMLYVEAWRASFGPVAKMHERWKSLAKVYPDFSAAPQNLAMTSWQFENRYAEALAAFEQAASIKGPLRTMSLQGIGHMQLALGKDADAAPRFAESRKAGLPTVYFGEADALAIAGRHDDALKFAADAVLPPNPLFAARRAMRIATYELDRGRLDAASGAAQEAFRASEQAASKGAPQRARIATIAIAIASGDAAAQEAGAAALVDAEISRAEGAWQRLDFGPLHNLAVLGDLAARAGWVEVARKAHQQLVAEPKLSDRPVLSAQARVLEARIALAGKDSDAAIAAVAPLLDGREPVAAHALLADAYAAAGRDEEARAQWQWLATHRGLAFEEWIDEFVAQPMNVLDVALSRLSLAESFAGGGDGKAAEQALGDFLKQWDRAKLPPVLERRVAAIAQPVSG